MGVSSSLIAAAIVYWVTDRRLIPTIVIAVAGIIGFLLTHFLAKKSSPSPQSSPIENKPVFENKPTIIVSTATAPVADRAYSEVLAFLERTMQHGRAATYFVEQIASATGLAEMQVANALQRLYSEGHVFRSQIEGVGTDGGHTRWGYVYWYAHF